MLEAAFAAATATLGAALGAAGSVFALAGRMTTALSGRAAEGDISTLAAGSSGGTADLILSVAAGGAQAAVYASAGVRIAAPA
jgi:hypothetical protein